MLPSLDRLIASGGLDHATWDQQIVIHQTSVLPSDALKSVNRQNRALPYLKAQDGTTLNVVVEPQLSLRRSNQARPSNKVRFFMQALGKKKRKPKTRNINRAARKRRPGRPGRPELVQLRIAGLEGQKELNI